MSRILTALTLLLLTGMAWAGSGDAVNTAQAFASTLQPPATDYSVAYLSQIFGTVGNALQGSSGQMLGQLFAIFNKGVLVVAALYLGMTTVQVCLRAATEGSFMGQNKSVHMIMLRIALGFGLIIPSSSTGYSILQDVFMKIVVASTGLADKTWNAALDYMQYGGSLYIPPSSLTTDTSMISAGLGPNRTTWPPSAASQSDVPNLDGMVSQIFLSEVCMVMSSNKAFNSGSSSGSSYSEPYQPIFDGKTSVYFPGVGDPHSPQSYKGTIYGPSGCGHVVYYNNPAVVTWPQSARDQALMYSYSAMKQLVVALLPVAQSVVERNLTPQIQGSGDALNLLNKTEGKQVFSALLGYANLITPYQKLSASQGQASSSAILSQAEAQGWIMAGGFYWNVEQANSVSAATGLSAMFPSAVTMNSSVYNAIAGNTVNTSLFKTLQNSATAITISQYAIAGYWQTYVGVQQNNISTSSSGASASGGGEGMLGQVVGSAVGQLAMGSFNPGKLGAGNYNPIVLLMNVGHNLLKIVVNVWVTAIAITLGLSVAAGICNSTSPAGLMFKTVMGWVKSIMMLITGALLVPGAILAYYVPMYPFAVFTFAAIGWFGMVLEGMAAAPLVCLGMTHPEGHDFLGKAEQAMMLFLSIFLRPALMVIGMIAFMVVSFVAFQMLIAGYGALLSGLQTAGASSMAYSIAMTGGVKQKLLALITTVLILVIFGMMTMEVVEQCAKLIYQLPNNISRWIGAPGMGEEYGQMAQAIKGSVSGAAEQVGKAGQVGADVAEGVGQIPEGIQDIYNKSASEGDVSTSGGPPPVPPV